MNTVIPLSSINNEALKNLNELRHTKVQHKSLMLPLNITIFHYCRRVMYRSRPLALILNINASYRMLQDLNFNRRGSRV
jgi:hypothetical protein